MRRCCRTRATTLRFIRGQGAGRERRDGDGDEERDSLSAQQAGRLYSGAVAFGDDGSHEVRHLRRPFTRQPDFDVDSVTYAFGELLARAEEPR
jgi:hypothetical protein